MILRAGAVVSNEDITNTGVFSVSFKEGIEPVNYVSPFGGQNAAFLAIPNPGDKVIVAYEPNSTTIEKCGNYYLGSVMGLFPDINVLTSSPSVEGGDESISQTEPPAITGIPGTISGPDVPEGVISLPKDKTMLPRHLNRAYEGRGVTPQMLGLTDHAGNAFLISDRSRGGSTPEDEPFQDESIQMISGAGKRVACVDTPQVNGIIIDNEFKGRDYIILSSGSNGAFAQGEFHVRTHGPINQFTDGGNMHLWVEEGKNLELTNKATGKDTTLLPDNPSRTMQPLTISDDDNVKDRIYAFGDETWGCVKLKSLNNNISVSALAEDAIIHIHTSGSNSQVIIHSAGTVDIVADQKITLQSKTKIEINAPIVDINGEETVYVDGGKVHLNKPHTPQPDWDF